jgi:DivIVA domain-containing protein
MPLTPADVHNVAFSKPPIGKRGYNEDEVDAFLDLVETELGRLVEDNADLRQRVSELDSELASARSGIVQVTQALPPYQPEPEVAVVVEERSTQLSDEQALKATRVLSLAQDTADRLTSTAIADADKMVADARSSAEQIVSEARYIAEATVTDAQQRSDAMLSDAQSRSESQLRQAYEKADFLQADAERKLGYLHCTVEAQKAVPTAIRPALPQAVARMLKEHGFAE